MTKCWAALLHYCAHFSGRHSFLDSASQEEKSFGAAVIKEYVEQAKRAAEIGKAKLDEGKNKNYM